MGREMLRLLHSEISQLIVSPEMRASWIDLTSMTSTISNVSLTLRPEKAKHGIRCVVSSVRIAFHIDAAQI
jgi:hypothetical protein